MIKLFLNLKNKIVSSSMLLCALFLLDSCVYSQPDTTKYTKPYQQQSVPVQKRTDGYYYNPNTNYPGYYGGYNYAPASRYYNNPYAMPPQNAYPYYDGDQYYKPPSAYGVEDEVPATPDRY